MYYCTHCHKTSGDKTGWYEDGIGGTYCQNCIFLAIELLDQDPPNAKEPVEVGHGETPPDTTMMLPYGYWNANASAASSVPARWLPDMLVAPTCIVCGQDAMQSHIENGKLTHYCAAHSPLLHEH